MNMPVSPQDFNGIEIVEHSGALMTSSLGVAERFEKRHADVLRAVDGLECSADFRERNFAFSTYRPDGQRRDYPYVLMTRDGFSFLAMGFTGARAAQWKEKHITAFNAMEEQLRTAQHPAMIDLNDPSQLVPLLTSYAQRTQIAEAKVVEMSPKADAFDRLDVAEGNLTVRPAAKVLGIMETKLTKWLELRRWAFRQNGKGPLQPYADKKAAGLLDMKLRHYDDPKTGEPKVDATLTITPKGMARLAQIFNREGGAA